MSEPLPPLRDRLGLLAEADELFEQGAVAQGAAHITGFGPREFLEEAVHLFDTAARKYRDLGLGLRAREAWSREAECHREIAAEHERWAKQCDENRDAIAVLWEEASDG